ncbi:MAG TPA: hypothetical protein VH092_17975 [Urbifossiella sp.]|nr:hypothetical protein [Urbifossiella sp.]
MSDDERLSLMEMLVQCVEEMARSAVPRGPVEPLPEWQAVASVFGHDGPEGQFRVSLPMRRVQPALE